MKSIFALPPSFGRLGKISVCAFISVTGLTSAQATPWNHASWPPAASTSDVTASVPVYAAVTATPTPSITLNFIKSGAYQIFRKDPTATTWGAAVQTFTSDVNTWTDTNVGVGQMYEYKCVLTDPPASPALIHIPNPKTFVNGTPANPTGYILTGINVDETQARGRIIVVVANDVPTALPTEYNQYISDLQADGWFVHQIAVTPGGYDVAGAHGLATVTVTNGGSGYIATSNTTASPPIFSTTNSTNDFMFTDTATGSIGFGTITVLTGGVISAVAIPVGAQGGNFNVGDTLTIGDVASKTGSGATFTVATITGIPTQTPATIHAQIQAIYNQFPGEVKDLVFVGRVPACRTSSTVRGDPDGHQVNDGATGSDGYYADMHGTYTDTGSNAGYFGFDGINAGTGELNTKNDNKFDQYFMSDAGGEADMGFGRIDLSNNIAGQYEALKFYFNKLHRFKTCSSDFLPGRRIIMREGNFENVDGTGWNMAYSVSPHGGPGFPSAANPANDIDCIAGADLPAEVVLDSDADYSAQHGPYLFYFKGSGGPSIGIGGKAVFWTGCQSHWGWWYSSTTSSGENAEPLRLGENSFGLSWTWDIFGTRYFYHRMNLGMDAGDMMRVSVNNVDSINGTYAFVTDPNSTDGGYIAPCTGGMFMNHIGDPTLRFFMVAPPSKLSVVGTNTQPSLSWTASSDAAVIGYHVYRAAVSGGVQTGPYTRITSSPVTGTTFSDTDVAVAPGTGQWTYMVRAIKLETTGSGTFYNASLGAVQSVDQTNQPATLVIASPTSLPDANWNTAYTTTLAATGGTPNYVWTVLTGNVPLGLTLNSDGSFSGLPTMAGIYNFTAKVTDAKGQTAQQSFTITTQSNSLLTLTPETSAYTISGQATRVQGPTESMQVGPGNFTYLRFNIAGLQLNNTFASAKLRVYTAPGLALTNNTLMEAGLTPDSLVNWSIGTLCWNNQPGDNTAVPPSFATQYPISLTYTDLDVTQELIYALANNTTGKFGVRLFTQSPGAVTICSSYSYGAAIPQLIIQTSNAPKISITTPTASPAVVFLNSGLQLSATVMAIPANAANVTQLWTKLSGPGTVTFGTPSATSTTATFSSVGDYVLQLSASDGVLQSSQNVAVRVTSAPINGPIDSLVLRMPFSESSGTTTADISGGNNNGTLNSNASFTTTGILGNDLTVNGSGVVTITDSAANPTPLDGYGALTISMWVKPSSQDTDNLFRNLLSKSGAFGFQVRQVSNGGQIFNSIAGIGAQQSAARLQVGVWTNIISVYNGADPNHTLQLFVNGAPGNVTASTITSVPRKATANTFIGAGSATDTHAFIGEIDELRIYKRVLTFAEIEDIAAGVPTNVGPVITTNTSLSGTAGSPLALAATVTDDGKPNNTLAYNWSLLSGPGPLNIASASAISTTGTPSAAGTYGLLFTASDGQITTFANVGASITAPAGVTYSSWASSHGLTGNNALPTAKLQPDGLTNLFKYALGLDPAVNYNPGAVGLPSVQIQNVSGTNFLSLSFTGNATDVTYTVQASSDLNSWTNIQSWPSSATPPGTVTVQDTQPTTASAKRFMRLLMTNP